jgi:carboxyl-terminal processing protease
MNKIISHLFYILLATLFSFSLPSPLIAETEQKQQEDTYRQLETFANVLSILQENYVEEIKAKEAIEGAIQGLLLSLDPHSSYMKAESYQEFRSETQGSFTGIGIEITLRDNVITVISPIADTPAAKAGIKAHDKIMRINGESTKNFTPLDAVKTLRGPKGSTVTISIFRDGFKELQDFELIRDTIPLQSVKSFVLKPGFGYIRIANFQSNTTREFKDHLAQLQDNGPLNGLVLDLRNNPGGLLNQAVRLTDIFLDEGLIVYTRGRNKEQDLTYQAHKNNSSLEFPLVLLVNEGSASASEIVAGAIQDHQRGVIVGSKTFGKGSVQTIIPLPDGAGLRMTTARYYTPKGRSIQATGIIPDVEVAYSEYVPEENNDSPGSTIFREEDLNNHITNTETSDNAAAGELDEEIQNMLMVDNQLKSAFNILKSLVLYVSYKESE